MKLLQNRPPSEINPKWLGKRCAAWHRVHLHRGRRGKVSESGLDVGMGARGVAQLIERQVRHIADIGSAS